MSSLPTETDSPPTAIPPTIAHRLSVFGLALLVSYLVAVLNGIVPLALLDPAWLVRLISALLDNAPIALVGLGLIHLASYLDPDDPRLTARRNAIAGWAIGATAGFFLLLPLQALSSLQGYQLIATSKASQMKLASLRAAEFRRAILEAPNVEELQRRIEKLQGQRLDLKKWTRPLPELRKVLLARLKFTEQRASSYLFNPLEPSVWAVTQRGLRVVVLAIAYGVAFAAGSQRRKSPHTLLQDWQHRWYQHWESANERLIERQEQRAFQEKLREEAEQHAILEQHRLQIAEQEGVEQPGGSVAPELIYNEELDYYQQILAEANGAGELEDPPLPEPLVVQPLDPDQVPTPFNAKVKDAYYSVDVDYFEQIRPDEPADATGKKP